jgi:hypothetical protein
MKPRYSILFLLVLLLGFLTSTRTSRAGNPTSGLREWTTQGFEAFRKGSFGNGGQNLYVSRAGVLQRIYLNDVNRDGYADIAICNSQEHMEAPPAFVYTDPLESRDRIELYTEGAVSGAVVDLNGDKYEDLVLAMEDDGTTSLLNAFVYYGAPRGLSERYCLKIPAPHCSSVAAGDFNGDGRIDLAFASDGKLRLFYQEALGFELKKFTDLDYVVNQLDAADLDHDGFSDLYCRTQESGASVLWGESSGLAADRASSLSSRAGLKPYAEAVMASEAEQSDRVRPLARIVRLGQKQFLFQPFLEKTFLIPVEKRVFGQPLVFNIRAAISVSQGDVNGDGRQDLIFACRDRSAGQERSWLYLEGDDTFDDDHRVPLPTESASDVAVRDADGDGFADILISRSQTQESYSTESYLFRGTSSGPARPLLLPSNGARRVFFAKTSDDPRLQAVFVNRFSRGIHGKLDAVFYLGGPDSFSKDRCLKVKGVGAVRAVCSDFTDDGVPDLILANGAENATREDPGSYCFIGNASVFSYEPSFTIPSKKTWSVETADLDRDGYLDLVVAPYQGDIKIFRGAAGGFDLKHPQVLHLESHGKLYDHPFRTMLADLNNDNWLDMVIPQVNGPNADRSFVVWGGPQGFDFQNHQELAVFKPAGLLARDLDGNGYLDLIIGGHRPTTGLPHDSFVYIYWNGPEGLRQSRRTQLPSNTANGIASADFNRDGILDLFFTSYTDGKERDIDSYLYWGQPSGGFNALKFSRLRTHSSSGCTAADFNEDGWVDLAVINHKTGNDHVGYSYVFWNGPTGFNEDHKTRLPSRGPHGMMTVQPGNQRDRGPDEYYISEPFQLPQGTSVRSIRWDAQLGPKTWVKAQLRESSSQKGLADARWQGPKGADSWFASGDSVDRLKEGRWIQYRLALGAQNSGSTPRVTRVAVEYSAP